MKRPSFNETARQEGIQALQAGQLDAAIDAFFRCLQSEPNDVEAQALIGVAYSQKGLHQQALRMLDQAARTQPGSAIIRFNHAVALERAGRAPEAIAAFREALRLDPYLEPARARLHALDLTVPDPPPPPAHAPAAEPAPAPPPAMVQCPACRRATRYQAACEFCGASLRG